MFLAATGIPKRSGCHAVSGTRFDTLLPNFTTICRRQNRPLYADVPSCRHHEFRNVHYVPVEQRLFQAVRIEFITFEGLHVPFDGCGTPTNLVLYCRKNYQCDLTPLLLRNIA